MISYSKVSCFSECPYKYKLRYLDKLETKFDEKATNALVLGTAIHEGIEHRSVEHAVENYKSNYSIWNVHNEVEVLKLETILPIAFRDIPEGEYEHKLLDGDFIGFIDLLVKVGDTTYDLYDFKYSNNVAHYKQSGQIHVYKYYYEKITGNTIRNMYYAIVPKNTAALNKMSEVELRESIATLKDEHIKFIPIEYDKQQVNFFFARKALMLKATTFEKKNSSKCIWCEYKKYCDSCGEDKSELKVKKDEPVQKNEVYEVGLW